MPQYVVDARYNGQVLDGYPVLVTEDKLWALYVAMNIEKEFGYKIYGIEAGVSVCEMTENKVYKQRKFLRPGEKSDGPIVVELIKETEEFKVKWHDLEARDEFEEYLERIRSGQEAPGPKVLSIPKAAHR